MADKPILYDQFNRPIERAVLTQEIAAPTITGVRSPYSGYPGDGLNPRRLAALLREADQGEPLRYFELAEQIEERDLHYAGVLGTRKRSIAQLEVKVDAASDNAEHVKHADTVRAWLDRDELQDELFDILDCIGKGVSFTEIIWDTSMGQWRPGKLAWRDPRWFRFDRVDGVTPQLRDVAGFLPLPPMKFIQAVIRAKSGLPVRSGLARLAAWSWMFKAFTLRDWAIFAQTFGQPVRVGKYPSGTTEADKDTLFRAVANIAGDCAAIIPDSMVLDFIESKNVGAGSDLFEKRANWLDRQISKAVLGQTATTDAIAGGHAVGQEHRQVQEDIERSDARVLSAILNRDLVRPWIDLEYGPQEKYPKLKVGRTEEKNIALVIDGVEKLVPLGLKVQQSEIRDLLGLADPDDGAELLEAPKPAPPALPGQTALPLPGTTDAARATLHAVNDSQIAVRATDAVDHLADAAEHVVAPGVDAMINAVRALVNRSHSFAELSAGLEKLQVPKDRFAELMSMAMVMADLSGRAEITHEAAAQ